MARKDSCGPNGQLRTICCKHEERKFATSQLQVAPDFRMERRNNGSAHVLDPCRTRTQARRGADRWGREADRGAARQGQVDRARAARRATRRGIVRRARHVCRA
ncbi:unnamed protein product [Rhizophagus irregularis]|uniref:Uncharacterized protein n=1 Tax=Rhizophagus irregularis TaxID=588596 RepID=A0A915ZVP6_9GLOM|nr:unnamed protein product [Rhizophagus irregularis]